MQAVANLRLIKGTKPAAVTLENKTKTSHVSAAKNEVTTWILHVYLMKKFLLLQLKTSVSNLARKTK